MQHEEPRRRSRFVTGLGWFAVVAGALSFFARAYGAVLAIAEPEATRSALFAPTHPLDLSVRDHLVLFALLYVVATLLLCITGVGLVRRRRWALWTYVAISAPMMIIWTAAYIAARRWTG